MIDKKIIIRLSNELGNQMFMYASSLGISKKLNRSLIVDNETAYLLKKNISKYGLNNFRITSDIAPNRKLDPGEKFNWNIIKKIFK